MFCANAIFLLIVLKSNIIIIIDNENNDAIIEIDIICFDEGENGSRVLVILVDFNILSELECSL
jgi:hypothetical protein